MVVFHGIGAATIGQGVAKGFGQEERGLEMGKRLMQLFLSRKLEPKQQESKF